MKPIVLIALCAGACGKTHHASDGQQPEKRASDASSPPAKDAGKGAIGNISHSVGARDAASDDKDAGKPRLSDASMSAPPRVADAGSPPRMTPDATVVAPPDDLEPVGTDLQIVFSRMYSGYDGIHTFKIPAVVPGLTGSTWSTMEAAAVALEDDPTTGGVLITTKRAGKVTIIARLGSKSGSALLDVTAFGASDCEVGNQRYNSGPQIDGSVLMAFTSNSVAPNTACGACHGNGAQFFSVQHTPQQSGGWSDNDLVNIMTAGFKPDGSVLLTMVPAQIYQRFHKWALTDAEKVGLVCYLRSIKPASQGQLDFGGLRPP